MSGIKTGLEKFEKIGRKYFEKEMDKERYEEIIRNQRDMICEINSELSLSEALLRECRQDYENIYYGNYQVIQRVHELEDEVYQLKRKIRKLKDEKNDQL